MYMLQTNFKNVQPFYCRLSPLVQAYQIFQLRKIITILLLTNFLVFQYARQVSYWECRVFNYFKTENQKCDCEKLIKVITGQTKPSPDPVIHNHFQLDESFYPSATITETNNLYSCFFNWSKAREIFICKMAPGRLDRPPQLL